jgi:hypothetical protein
VAIPPVAIDVERSVEREGRIVRDATDRGEALSEEVKSRGFGLKMAEIERPAAEGRLAARGIF